MIRNPLVKKILIILLVLIFAAFVFSFAFNAFFKSYNNLVYDLGEEDILEYSDIIITNYDEYVNFANDFDIPKDLNKNDFNKNYYLASFQEYDSCSEKKHKTIEKIDKSDGLKVTYKVYNKCGMCKPHVTLHIVNVGKVNENAKIEYNYSYLNDKLDCGKI